MENGYYRIDNLDGTTFIAMREDGFWFIPGVEDNVTIFPRQVLYKIPDHESGTGESALQQDNVVTLHKKSGLVDPSAFTDEEDKKRAREVVAQRLVDQAEEVAVRVREGAVTTVMMLTRINPTGGDVYSFGDRTGVVLLGCLEITKYKISAHLCQSETD